MAEQHTVQLSDTEDVVAYARIHVLRLADSLAADPINRDTYADIAAYLEGPGWRACDALDTLRALSTEAAQTRVVEVLAATAYALPPSAHLHRRSSL